jgi:hypothetical protein
MAMPQAMGAASLIHAAPWEAKALKNASPAKTASASKKMRLDGAP